ncbi:MAG TPA: ABC transporter ATP-binding protein [Candidatus Acidoferrales bacterium]|jgi:ATP-binding cassette subfamily B protein|nr:ABC transporter ATP-binding protein [Candidatus Acidoferrales bacterium]
MPAKVESIGKASEGEKSEAQAAGAKWSERLKALRRIPPIFRMVWNCAPEVVFMSAVARVIVSVIPVALLKVTQIIIDAIDHHHAYHTALPHYFWPLVGVEFVLASAVAMLGRVTTFFDTVLADKFTRHISTSIMEHASRLDLTRYEDPLFYDKMERARVQGTDRVMLVQMTGRLIQDVIGALSLALGIVFFSPLLLFFLIVCVVPAFLGETHFAFLGYSLNFEQTPARRQMDYLRILGGSRESAKELKLFGLGPFLVGRYKGLSDELHEQNVRLAKRKLLFGAFLTVLGTVGYYGGYAYVIFETVMGRLTIGQLTFLAGAIAGASAGIQAVFTTFSGIADQALFMTDLVDFFAVQPTIQSKPGALVAPRPIRHGVEFRNVSFAYPGSRRQVLSGVNVRIEPHERIALVGENGQGKTTIVKLLTRLYDPTEGQILLDGVDLREYNLDDLWKEIGVIFQDFVHYEMTAAENIGVGRIEEANNPFRIRAAAMKTFAEKVIQKLPKGYDQLLGKRFEGGVDLSGGEWQKIALARAYLRDAQLLILDEPTAALDARAENEVFQRFAELTQGKMSLLISHRFSTVRMADRILVLQQGGIAEQGKHDQLVKDGGIYAEMFELQAANYR